MTQSVAVSTTYKAMAAEYVGVSTAWKHVFEMWTGISGAWKVFYLSFAGSQSDYSSGSGNETVPTGASSVTITAYGPGGDGGAGYDDGLGDVFEGGGGASGAKVVYTLAISPADWGQNIAWAVGVHGSSDTTVSKALTNGTIGITAAHGGNGGDAATPGAGGAASGGNVLNQNGNDGGGDDVANGGAAIDGYGAGGAGNTSGVPGVPPGGSGDVGHLTFAWT